MNMKSESKIQRIEVKMKKTPVNFLISSILLCISAILFSLFGIWPIINFIAGNANAGYIIFVITIPVTSLMFLCSLIYFIISLQINQKTK